MDVGKNLLEINVKIVKKFLKEKLSTIPPTDSFQEEQVELLNFLKRTVLYGESDSTLIVGPRGCGKTTLINSCLNTLSNDCGSDYVVVKLNGLIHSDDNLALRAIIEQLHVKKLDGDQIAGSFSDNLMFVLQSLKACDRQRTLPIIFILDVFELFCYHKNQTLLYNLFDLAKSGEAPMCVIGISTRYDITELLEKRVSSRFSHRQILLMPSCSINERILLISDCLKINKPSSHHLKKLSHKFIDEWNLNIVKLLDTSEVISCISRQLDIEPNSKAIKNTLFQIISGISFLHPFITVLNFEEAFRKYLVDEKVAFLKDLSVLELCLVVSMAHQVEIFEGEPFNFEMIFKRYSKFASHSSSFQITHRPILVKAFERIKDLELILPLTNCNRNQKKEYILYNLLVTRSQVRTAISFYNELPTEVSHWALGNVI